MRSNKELFEELKNNIALLNMEREEYTLNEKNNWRVYKMKRKIIAISISCFLLISGVTFAFNSEMIVNYIRGLGLGNGIDTAVENGYIAEPNMEYKESNVSAIDEEKGITLENVNVKAKIDDFLMDDLNISSRFSFEIDPIINNTINFEELNSVELKDLIVTDEDYNILFCFNKEAFQNYCLENNLNYDFNEFNDKHYNCGLNSFITNKNKENSSIQITYNMYSDGSKSFPKSKKLYFKFSNIVLKRNDWIENENSIVSLKGNWQIDVDVPEKMYNRQSISYKVIKCDNNDFEVTNATLYDTGFEFGMIVSNIKEPDVPKLLIDKGIFKVNEEGKAYLIYNEDTEKLLREDIDVKEAFNKYRARPIEAYRSPTNDSFETITYVENEEGQKFESTMSPSRRAEGNYIDGNKYSFYETFSLTKSNATDKLKVKVLYNNVQYIIELEKVEN